MIETENDGRFVVTVPLYTSPHAISVLEKRFNVAHHIYNCFLGECERRRKAYQSTLPYKQAIIFINLIRKKKNQIEKSKNKKEVAEIKLEVSSLEKKKKELFDDAKKLSGFYMRNSKQYGMTNGLETFCSNTIASTWLSEHVDSHCRNQLMIRAFKACERAMFAPKAKNKKGLFKKPRVKFKKFNKDYIHSVEGKDYKSPLKIKKINDKMYLVWSELNLPMIIKEGDIKIAQMLELFNSNETTYSRLLRKRVENKWMYFAQIMCKGVPVKKENQILGTGVVGLDIGPSTVAIVSDESVELREIFADLKITAAYAELDKKEKRLERKVDRQRRQNNPGNYNENGTVKKEAKKWKKSNRQIVTERKRDDLRRRIAETRKISMRTLAWELRAKGDELRLDKDSYKGWQKQYGKSIGKHAPGMLVATIQEIFDRTGGVVLPLNTFVTKSSQTCPTCLKIVKKGLTEGKDSRSIRIHECSCGFLMQRDIVSAMNNKFFNIEKQTVDADKAKAFVKEKKPLLQACIEQVIQQARERQFLPSTFGTFPELGRVACNDE